MEFRVLQYFLAVTREQSISGAAEALHLSQPTLSRQLKELEEELGKQLFLRGSRKITLTEEGMILRKRAEEITALMQMARDEIALTEESISGDVYIGAGETEGVSYLARAARQLQEEYPLIRYHIASGDTIDVMESLDRGLIDFGLLFDEADAGKYQQLTLPVRDLYGLMLQRDNPLAEKPSIAPADLWEQPLILNRNMKGNTLLRRWLKKDFSELNVTATYNLLYNGSRMVAEGLGSAICLDGIINTTGSPLCFRPFSPPLEAEMHLVWKRYQMLSKPAEKFLSALQELVS